MLKDIVVNLSLGAKRDVAGDYAISVAQAFEAHVVCHCLPISRRVARHHRRFRRRRQHYRDAAARDRKNGGGGGGTIRARREAGRHFI